MARYEVVCVARQNQFSGPPNFTEVDAINWVTLSYTDELNAPQTLDVNCNIPDLTEPVLQRLRALHEQATELWLYRDGQLVVAGPLAGWSVQGDTITLKGLGILAYLRGMLLLQDYDFVDADQFTIVKTMVDAWQDGIRLTIFTPPTPNLGFGHFGIYTDNIGTSGVAVSQSYKWMENNVVLERIADLSKRRNGFDFEIDPVSRRLQLWTPLKGVDRSVGDNAVVFDGATITNRNVICAAGPGELASVVLAVSQNRTGMDINTAEFGTHLHLLYDVDMIPQFGAWGFLQQFDAADSATLFEYAMGAWSTHNEARMVPGPGTMVTADTDPSLYSVGDVVNYSLHDQLQINGSFRIRKRTVNVSATGKESVSHEFT